MSKTEKPAATPLDCYSTDDLRALLGAVAAELARRVNETEMTAEQAEDISRRST